MTRAICAVCLLFLWGCVTSQSSIVKLDNSAEYAASDKTIILLEPPTRDFKKIAIIETRGVGNAGLPEMLDGMKQEAQKVGADAVLPVQDTSETVPPSVIYNPWLGGYQTIGGGRISRIRGIAIKYTD
ncbi:MAG: hypothetical protein KME37_07675 [Candidatus Thiodiazotropha sp. (ex Codakia orbicularis)]|nr:hypothetical protein [Candidatus Thiodiazotropha sp. (ex Codakia orbicularis)]